MGCTHNTMEIDALKMHVIEYLSLEHTYKN